MVELFREHREALYNQCLQYIYSYFIGFRRWCYYFSTLVDSGAYGFGLFVPLCSGIPPLFRIWHPGPMNKMPLS